MECISWLQEQGWNNRPVFDLYTYSKSPTKVWYISLKQAIGMLNSGDLDVLVSSREVDVDFTNCTLIPVTNDISTGELYMYKRLNLSDNGVYIENL